MPKSSGLRLTAALLVLAVLTGFLVAVTQRPGMAGAASALGQANSKPRVALPASAPAVTDRVALPAALQGAPATPASGLTSLVGKPSKVAAPHGPMSCSMTAPAPPTGQKRGGVVANTDPTGDNPDQYYAPGVIVMPSTSTTTPVSTAYGWIGV